MPKSRIRTFWVDHFLCLSWLERCILTLFRGSLVNLRFLHIQDYEILRTSELFWILVQENLSFFFRKLWLINFTSVDRRHHSHSFTIVILILRAIHRRVWVLIVKVLFDIMEFLSNSLLWLVLAYCEPVYIPRQGQQGGVSVLSKILKISQQV